MVCEKTNFKKPSIMKCTACTVYTPYLSIAELAKREKKRYKNFLKRPQQKNCKVCGKDIKTNNSDIKKCRTNCNTLLAFMENGQKWSSKNQKSVQKKLV